MLVSLGRKTARSGAQAAEFRHGASPVPAVGFPSPDYPPQHKEDQCGAATKASVGGKVTAHFSLNAPVWSSHLITRCFKQMAREGRAGSWLLPKG